MKKAMANILLGLDLTDLLKALIVLCIWNYLE